MASEYDLYNARININGSNKRDRMINTFKDSLLRKLDGNPSVRNVTINGIVKSLVIISTDDPYKKKITSLPNESFNSGNIVVFESTNWLITKADLDDEIYVDGQMIFCPNLLKFQNPQGIVLSYPYFTYHK
jgi:hypothetical protein